MASVRAGLTTFRGLLDACFAVLLMAAFTARFLLPRRKIHRGVSRNLLVIDTAYDLDALERRGALRLVTARDLDGFFERVWFTHPIVGASPLHRSNAEGRPRVKAVDAGHVFVEGHASWKRDSRWPMTSFVRAQVAYLRELESMISVHGVAVIQAGDPYYPGLLSLMLARRYRAAPAVRIPGNYDAIYEATGRLAYPRLIKNRRLERLVVRFVLSRASLVFPASADNRGFAVANGARPERCVVIPAYADVIHPVHLTEPAERTGTVEPLPDLFILMISRLEPVKHPEDAVEVLAALHERGHRVSLVLVGEGSMRPELEALADRMGVSSEIIFAGDRPQEWIAKAAAEAAAILAPLSGRALVEALLSARPVVAYDVEWHGEIITDGVNGCLVQYRDRRAMAAATERLLLDRSVAVTLGERGRRSAMELVEPSRVRELQRNAYRAAIEASG